MSLTSHYYETVRRRATEIGLPHGLAMTVVDYAVHGARPGFLLRSVLINDLEGAMEAVKGNTTLAAQMPALVTLVRELVDESLRGSRAAVDAWVLNHERWRAQR